MVKGCRVVDIQITHEYQASPLASLALLDLLVVNTTMVFDKNYSEMRKY